MWLNQSESRTGIIRFIFIIYTHYVIIAYSFIMYSNTEEQTTENTAILTE